MKNVLVYFFSFLTFFYTFMSCAPETEDPVTTADYTLLAMDTLHGIEVIENHFATSRDPIPLVFDQATVDFYADLLGYSPGEVSVELVNSVMEKMGVATTEGVQAVLAEYELSAFFRMAIQSISNGEVFTDLSSIPDYLLLDQNEKELLTMANTVAQAEMNAGRSCGGWGGVGTIIGAIIGGVLCGICALIGGIIGGGIGCQAGGGKP